MEVDGTKLKRNIPISFKFTDERYEELLLSLEDSVVSAEVERGYALIFYKPVEIPNQFKDAVGLIKALVAENGGKMTKEAFYQNYCRLAKCTERTARNHLRLALEQGVIQPDGYYGIQLI